MSRYRARFHDPDGRRHRGFPTYGWRCAPDHLLTRRQLASRGLRPATSEPVGQMLWYSGRGRKPGQAYLYDVTRAVPKQPMTPGMWRRHEAMMRARRTCRQCQSVWTYDLPKKFNRTCLDCLELEGLL